MNIFFSDTESARFGLPVYRSQSDVFDTKAIHTFLEAHPTALLICRVPVQAQPQLHQFNAMGINYLMADTLLCYSYDLKQHLAKPLNNALTFEIARYSDEPILNELIQDIFKDYSNHYLANPILDKTSITAGYQEWMKAYLAANEEDKITFLVKKNHQLVGFAACRKITKETVEGALLGVKPAFSQQGIYTDIIRFVKDFFCQKETNTFRISTQIQNIPVQRIWIKEGFLLDKAWLTLHVFGREVQLTQK